MSAQEAIIQTITCPITCEVMREPVIGSDNNTYEKDAIIRWLRTNQKSPLTNETMTIDSLRVNPAIRYLCDQYHEGNLNMPPSTNSSLVTNVETPNININSTIIKGEDSNFTVCIKDECSENLIGYDIILCIDRSGSTSVNVEAKDEDGNNIENGLSICDIIKHASKTVSAVLDEKDRFGCVIFDNTVETLVPLTKTTEINKTSINSKIDDITPRNQTNIYGSIQSALKLLDERDDKSRNTAIIMLTDGQPNISPSRGELETLKREKQRTNFSTPIYTFGFGYNLIRGLLYNLAQAANGTTGHIPDGGMIATVFCNAIANIKSTIAENMQINIINGENLISRIYGDFPYKINDKKELVINIGTLQFQQSRNISLLTNNNNIQYYLIYTSCGKTYQTDIINSENSIQNNPYVLQEKIRSITVEKLRDIIKHKSNANDNGADISYQDIIDLCDKINCPLTSNIKETMEDQIYKALNNHSWYKRWGEFYIDQLSSCLNNEKRPNYKDKACLTFGGEFFEKIVDYASDKFDTLPPPTPSNINTSIYRSIGYANNPPPPINMSTYNSSVGPCYKGTCIALMADNTYKTVDSLVKGDIIMSLSDYNRPGSLTTARIKYIVKTNTSKLPLVTFKKGLVITPWHPIYYERDWVFPANVEDAIVQECPAIYSLVLETNHIAIINNTPTICLGHNFDYSILKHDYYGSNKVIDDLEKMIIDTNGIIQLQEGCMIYNENNLVTKLVQ